MFFCLWSTATCCQPCFPNLVCLTSWWIITWKCSPDGDALIISRLNLCGPSSGVEMLWCTVLQKWIENNLLENFVNSRNLYSSSHQSTVGTRISISSRMSPEGIAINGNSQGVTPSSPRLAAVSCWLCFYALWYFLSWLSDWGYGRTNFEPWLPVPAGYQLLGITLNVYRHFAVYLGRVGQG